MRTIGIRQLRNQVSEVIRRARAGERMLITVNGVPAAQIGPVTDVAEPLSVHELISSGLLRPPRSSRPVPTPDAVDLPEGISSEKILADLRSG